MKFRTKAFLFILSTVVGLAEAATLSIDPSASGFIDWNSAVWGSPAAMPTVGNDYIHDSGSAYLLALGLQDGFDGDQLTLKSGAILVGKGDGALSGTLILDGGQWQQRAGGTSTVSGDIHVQSSSQILLIDGSLKWSVNLSCSPERTLRVINFNQASREMIFDAVDTGFLGTFNVEDTQAADFPWKIKFDRSYTNAVLTITGDSGNAARAAVYQLTGHVTFKEVRMPNGFGDMVELAPGTYNATALMNAGVSSTYYADLGGSITVSTGPIGQAGIQYLGIARMHGWNENDTLIWDQNQPSTISQASIDEMLDMTGGSRGTPMRRFAFSFITSYLNGSIENATESLQRALALSEKNNFPVIVHLDGVNWWHKRPDLWNWWDPAAPGYKVENKNNVEWFDWGSSNAVKIGWRNWGSQLRVAPQPNLASPVVLDAHREQLNVLTPVIVEWYEGLPEDKKYLLGGVVLGWEASTYLNAYYYPNGNSYLGQNPANDPQGGIPASIPMGYAGATTLGLQPSHTSPVSDESRIAVVKYYLEQVVEVARTNGLPVDKIVTHGVDATGHSGAGALVDSVVPGWSVYNTVPSDYDDLLDPLNGAPWGAIEFQPWNLTESLFNSFFSHRNCRYVNIFHWEALRDSYSAALGEISGWLSDGRLSGNLSFGEVQSGQTAIRTLTIHNDGATPMTVSNIVYPDGFSGAWSGGTIPAGGSQGVSVTFSPQDGRIRGGQIIVESDLASSPHTRSYSGAGVISYSIWAAAWGVDIGSETNDYDGDLYENLWEYAMDGDPTNSAEWGALPVFKYDGAVFTYMHAQRVDDTNLAYYLETRNDLVEGNWVSSGYTVTGTNVTGNLLDVVTNTISTAADETFVRIGVDNP